ncbi:MAG: hypothetical protein NC307_05985 [Roseburia sp.]|nr:hypothetical protein [Roseburia sp.]
MDVLLSSKEAPSEKKKILQDNFDIKMTKELENVQELYAEYHIAKLDTGVFLKKGSKFSVVISYGTQDGGKVAIPVDYLCNGTWYRNKASCEITVENRAVLINNLPQ